MTFARDDAWQRDLRDRVIVPFYEQRTRGRFVLLDGPGLARELQRQHGVDALLQAADGRAIGIEEKLVRWPARGHAYTAFVLETASNINAGRERDGWMRTSSADYLLYGFEQPDGTVDAYLIDFPALRRWFEPLEETFATFETRGASDSPNRSVGRVVPIADVMRNVTAWKIELGREAQAPAANGYRKFDAAAYGQKWTGRI